MNDVNLILASRDALGEGLLTTFAILVVGATIAIAGGLLCCAMRMSRSRAPRAFAVVYIALFRIIPEVILIFWAYFCIPFLFHERVSGFWAGTTTLGLIGAGYLAEIFRAGILAVPKGQTEAARALGLHRWPIWYRVVGPQALRVSVPALMNYLTEFLKNTTLLAAIGVGELSLQALLLGGQTFRYMAFLSSIAIIYFALLFPLGLLSRRLEHRVG